MLVPPRQGVRFGIFLNFVHVLSRLAASRQRVKTGNFTVLLLLTCLLSGVPTSNQHYRVMEVRRCALPMLLSTDCDVLTTEDLGSLPLPTR